jgi:tetratricopeptide (TPR) repeat protein
MTKRLWIPLLIALLFGACTSSEKRIEKEREKNPKYQYNVGIFYLNNGQPDEAITYLENALTLQPRFDLALDGMGLAMTMKGKFNEAIKYFQECLEVNPTLTDAHNHLGSVYQELGALDQAERHFLAAVGDETYHSRELPLYNLARLYYLQEKNDLAMEYVTRAIMVNRRLSMAHNLKGLIYERLKKYPEAISSYQAALDQLPEDINLIYNLAGARFKNGDYRTAKKLFESIQEKVVDPDMKSNVSRYLEMIEKEIRT